MTTDVNKLVEPIHDRMPVVLSGRGDVGELLNVGSSEGEISGLLLPCASEVLMKYAVSEYVNAPVHPGPECVVTVGTQ